LISKEKEAELIQALIQEIHLLGKFIR